MKCRACEKEHPSHIRCEIWARQNAAPVELPAGELLGGVKTPAHFAQPVQQPQEAAPIRKVKEFLKKVGRPSLNRTEKEKRSMRLNYMRGYRARKKVLGDGRDSPKTESGAE